MKNLPLLLMKLVLFAVVLFLAYRLADGIRGPIQFDKERQIRLEAVEKKLEKIKQTQDAYKTIYGYYAGSFDSLKLAVRNDSLPIEKKVLIPKAEYNEDEYGPNPKLADDTTKYIINTTYLVPLTDTLFNARSSVKLDDLEIIPYSNNAPFYLNAGEIDASGGRYKVVVYEVTAPNRLIYEGLDKKYFGANEGMQLGSMYEANTEIRYNREGVYYP